MTNNASPENIRDRQLSKVGVPTVLTNKAGSVRVQEQNAKTGLHELRAMLGRMLKTLIGPNPVSNSKKPIPKVSHTKIIRWTRHANKEFFRTVSQTAVTPSRGLEVRRNPTLLFMQNWNKKKSK